MKYNILVVQNVEIELNEEAFTEEFMEEFRDSFYSFWDKEEHAEHIAQLYARGVFGSKRDFVEGYGVISEFIKEIQVVDSWEEIWD